MLSAEGHVHKRQRRVATPAFSVQAMRDLVPVVFRKAVALKDKWSTIMCEADARSGQGHVFDVCNWASRVTFDVMGSAGFDYELGAINNGENELLRAYTEMFDIAISQNTGGWWDLVTLHLPVVAEIFVSIFIVHRDFGCLTSWSSFSLVRPSGSSLNVRKSYTG